MVSDSVRVLRRIFGNKRKLHEAGENCITISFTSLHRTVFVADEMRGLGKTTHLGNEKSLYRNC